MKVLLSVLHFGLLRNFEPLVVELSNRGHEVVLMRVLDPSELEFDFKDATTFFDLESGRDLLAAVERSDDPRMREAAARHRALQVAEEDVVGEAALLAEQNKNRTGPSLPDRRAHLWRSQRS